MRTATTRTGSSTSFGRHPSCRSPTRSTSSPATASYYSSRTTRTSALTSSKSPISAQPAADAPDVGADHMQAYGREPSLIVSDPAKHDKQRRQVMRHFAPPHSPDVIPNMAVRHPDAVQ